MSVDLGYVSFCWVYREANLATHELAKWSCIHSHFGSFGPGHWPPSVVNANVKEADPFTYVAFLYFNKVSYSSRKKKLYVFWALKQWWFEEFFLR